MSVLKVNDTRVSDMTGAACTALAKGRLAPTSLIRNSDLIRGFAAFLARSNVELAADITPQLASAYVHSLTRSGGEPSVATMRLRRSALRLLFREALATGLVETDPTAEMVLAKRTYRDTRTLTDAEVEKCRAEASALLGDQRFALVGVCRGNSARSRARPRPAFGLRPRNGIGPSLRLLQRRTKVGSAHRVGPRTSRGGR